MTAMPTTTHMTKHSVKKSNNGDLKNRSNQTWSVYALAHNALIRDTAEKKMCKEDAASKELWVRSKEKSLKLVMHTMKICQ